MTSKTESQPIRFSEAGGQPLSEFLATCEADAVVELAPGRYEGPIRICRPVSLKGAGDLTRVFSPGQGTVLTVELPDEGSVALDSLLIEGGNSADGGGLEVLSGQVRLHNVHIRDCRADGGRGGAIHVKGGELDATRLRAHDVQGEWGGALSAEGSAVLRVRDAQITKSQARLGGAISIEGDARVFLEGMTIAKSRATQASGGQAIHVGGTGVPSLKMLRVRLEDAPLGLPVVIDAQSKAEVTVAECDLPRVVQKMAGVVDGGENHWR